MADSTVELRKCKKCGVEKPLTDFPADRLNPTEPYKSQGKLYKQHGCIECLKREKQEYYVANCDTIRAYKKKKYYDDPEAARAVAREYSRTEKSQKTRAEHYANNVEWLRHIGRLNARAWRLKNPEESRLNSKKGKAKRKNAKLEKITKEQINNLYKQQRGHCAICQKNLKDVYHVDHIVPLAGGGAHEIKNLQLLCPSCNLSKNDHDPIVYMQRRGFLL